MFHINRATCSLFLFYILFELCQLKNDGKQVSFLTQSEYTISLFLSIHFAQEFNLSARGRQADKRDVKVKRAKLLGSAALLNCELPFSEVGETIENKYIGPIFSFSFALFKKKNLKFLVKLHNYKTVGQTFSEEKAI